MACCFYEWRLVIHVASRVRVRRVRRSAESGTAESAESGAAESAESGAAESGGAESTESGAADVRESGRRVRRCVRRTLAAPPVFPRRTARAATMQPPRPCVRRALTLITTRRLAIITRAVRTLLTTTPTAMTIVGSRVAIYLTQTLVRQRRAVTTLQTTTTVDIVIWMILKCVLLHQRLL